MKLQLRTFAAPKTHRPKGDRRFKIDGKVVNFHVHYEIDDDTSKHVLALDEYGGTGVGSWVLLEEAP